MLRTIYTSAERALERVTVTTTNTMVLLMSWKKKWPTGRLQKASFFFLLSIQCCGRHRRNVYGLQPVQRSPVQKDKCQTLEDIFAYEHLTVSLHRSFLVRRSWFSHFSWIRLNIQRIFVFFLSLNCRDIKGHWDIVREERRMKATEQRHVSPTSREERLSDVQLGSRNMNLF